jgi:hypothetical protein
MADWAVSDVLLADVVDACQDPTVEPRWTVHAAPVPTRALPPYVAVHPLFADPVGQSIGLEDWGQWHDRYQLTCVGVNAAQAQWLARQIIALAWPAGWELVDPGTAAQDPEPAPALWTVPVTMRYTVPV